MDERLNFGTEDTVLARARGLAGALAAAGDEIERTRRIPEPLLTRLHESRLFRLLLPRRYGGEEVAPWVWLHALEEVARHDSSVGWNMFVANSAALIAPFLPPETARTIFADPRALIAWGPPSPDRARAVPGGYRVTSRSGFASGCRQASWLGMHCLVEEPDGTLRLNRAGRPTLRTLLFPAEQGEVLDSWDTIGLRGTASDTIAVTDLFVPEAFSGTRDDPSLRRVEGPLYAFTMQGLYAVGVAGVALGTADAMLAAFARLAGDKAPRALGRRLAEDAATQAGYAQWVARLASARAWLRAVLAEIHGRADEIAPIGMADRAQVRLAATNAIHGAIEVADQVYKEAGVDSIFPGSPFERRFRDIHTLSQQIQARGDHYRAVGQVMLGCPPDVFL